MPPARGIVPAGRAELPALALARSVEPWSSVAALLTYG